MSKNMEHLTNSEKDLMEIFWTQAKPLTSVDILKIADNCSWNGNYIHVMLRSVMKKGLIRICGTIQYGTQYARQFIPVVTKEEYAAKLAMSTGLESSSISKVAVAMAKETGSGEELIVELEKIIAQLKEKEKKEQ